MDEIAKDERKRVLEVTAGNLRQNHLYVRGHYDFFPAECIGPLKNGAVILDRHVEIYLDGLGELITTELAADAKTGKPRGFFRDRASLARFYKHHQLQAGAKLTIERVAERRYQLSVVGQGRSWTAAEFFSGIGLVRLALERQGWQVVFANDIDEEKARMYRENWPADDHLLIGDIHDLSAESIPSCDLATASFPCNDLSIAGRWEGLSGKHSSAFWGFVKLLREMGSRRPLLILIENVVGFLMKNAGRDLEQAIVALNDLGYGMDAIILNAIHWVPQSRARLFLIGKQGETPSAERFVPISGVRPRALAEFIVAHRNIRWNIRELPQLPEPTARLPEIVEDLPEDDPPWWDKERARYFMNQLSERHAEDARQMIKGKRISYATAFRRVRNGKSMAELRTDGIAGCLRTPRGGSGRQILFKAGLGKHQVRLMTARECARLQGVPDSYPIKVPLNKALFGFGDAVCVPTVEWITSHYLSKLA